MFSFSSPIAADTSSVYRYKAYGLIVESAIRLPELVATTSEGVADIFIRLGQLPAPPPDGAEGCLEVSAEQALFFWDEAGVYLVREGREIIVDPLPNADMRVVRPYLVGAGLGIAHHQRGNLVLHASAVVIGNSVVAFIAESGEGKTTTVAALHARGHAVIADDVVVLRGSSTSPMIEPAYPRLKLCPEPAAALGYDLQTLPALDDYDERRDVRVEDGFPAEPLPLSQIYILAEGESTAIIPMTRQEAFVELIRHSYAPRLLRSAGAPPAHFQQCAALAGTLPIFYLRRQRTLESLAEVVNAVEAHTAGAIQ